MAYTEPCKDRPCHECKHSRYDSVFGELWCNHVPEPEMIRDQLVVDNWGTCEYWESEDA